MSSSPIRPLIFAILCLIAALPLAVASAGRVRDDRVLFPTDEPVRLSADFDLAFVAGEPWPMAAEDQQETKIALTTITWDAAAGRYVTKSLEL